MEESPHLEMQMAQTDFLAKGGTLQRVLAAKYKSGELSRIYIFREFPKALNISLGHEEVERSTEVGNGDRKVAWKERREVFANLVVQNPDEEDETLAAVDRAAELGIAIGADWTAERLREVVALAERGSRPTRPLTAAERKAARIEALRLELATLTDEEADGAAPNPLATQPARRPHRRTHPAAQPDATEAPPTDQAA
jgi:hypothetical protein